MSDLKAAFQELEKHTPRIDTMILDEVRYQKEKEPQLLFLLPDAESPLGLNREQLTEEGKAVLDAVLAKHRSEFAVELTPEKD